MKSCTQLVSENMDITVLPLAILSKYKSCGYKSDNTFLVCGFDKNNEGFIYRICVRTNSVEQVFGNRDFGCTWYGVSGVASPILKQAECDRISLLDATMLCKLAIETTGKSQFYCGAEITVGNKADVYVMHRSGSVSWVSGDAGFLANTKGY